MLRRSLMTALVALLAAGPASAGTIVAHLSLQSGKLAVAAAPTTIRAGSTVSIAVRIADGRGTGKGWTLKLANARGLTVMGITARCAASSTCTLPTAASTPAGATVLQAQHDTGMGIIDLVVTVKAAAAASVAFAVS